MIRIKRSSYGSMVAALDSEKGDDLRVYAHRINGNWVVTVDRSNDAGLDERHTIGEYPSARVGVAAADRVAKERGW